MSEIDDAFDRARRILSGQERALNLEDSRELAEAARKFIETINAMGGTLVKAETSTIHAAAHWHLTREQAKAAGVPIHPEAVGVNVYGMAPEVNPLPGRSVTGPVPARCQTCGAFFDDCRCFGPEEVEP